MADIVLINPRFEVSFWGLDYSLPLIGKRAPMPVSSLPLLAALTPPEHTVTLIDENVEAIDLDRCARADIVGVTGLSVQRHRMKEILTELKRRSCFVVVGGAWITVQEDYLDGLADVIFVGEAEETWPRFLSEWRQGLHQYRYEQAEKTDMTTVPVPRLDLLKMRHYLFGSLQFSRGCPFQCEFCDIIVTFGRRPRFKTSAQVIAELEAQLSQGVFSCYVVDDNLVGNKKAIKAVLKDVAAWQKKNGYPLVLFTEASIDLADDPELLQLMVEANFGSVFVGIESPNEESLRETKKLQNVRSGGTLVEKVHRIQNAGIEVSCGMILGFDHDDHTIFEAQCRFLKEARIANAMIGMLHAIPKTPLYDRLAAEGRLDPSDDSEFGTNVIPLLLSREELREGYLQTLQRLYSPKAYFDRVDDLYLRTNIKWYGAANKYRHKNPLSWLRFKATRLLLAAFFTARLLLGVPDASLRREYRHRIGRLLRKTTDLQVVLKYLFMCANHYHVYMMTKKMIDNRSPVRSHV